MNITKDRTEKEIRNLFADPKYSRQAWKAVGQAILLSPAHPPCPSYDRDGNETNQYTFEKYSYEKLAEDLRTLVKEDRAPTELEMIMRCQIAKARTDTSAAIFVRDTLGAKPVDESKLDAQVSNPYETLSDDELEAIAMMRAQRASQTPSSTVVLPTAHSLVTSANDPSPSCTGDEQEDAPHA